ncbi:MAG: hypothetical protein CRN43_09705 [Candidatus Nephrothrix sp. EaCA]|nr:MAG: hypothetical protein CRN43_09705 [Candidatus Nephrothrix sp. EaCA]
MKPNKSGALVVSYDPKGKSGYFNKKISVQTDWFNFLMNVEISGNVVRNNHAPAKWAYKNGNLRMQQRSVFFKQAYINKTSAPADFALLNDSDAPIVISKIKSPPYLQVQLPTSIGARQAVNMSVTCDGAKRKLGYHRDTIELWTNDADNKVKKIPVYAMVEEYFPPLTDSEFFKAPAAVLNAPSINFGVVGTASVERNVILKNVGLRELRIRDIIPNHFSISVVPSYKNTLQKNDTVQLKFIFTPYGQTGRLHKAAALFTNDPRNPVQNILMTMECQ